MPQDAQQFLALSLVGAAAFYLGQRFWRKYGAAAAAGYFLKKGRVSLAMKLKRQSKAGCSDCH